MAVLKSKQLSTRLSGSYILSGSTQTFIGASSFQGSVTASGDISGSVTSTGSFGRLQVAGNTDFTGDLTLGGNIQIGDADTDSITITSDLTSNLVPNADSTYDLGTSTKYWRNAYNDSVITTGNVSGSSISTGSFGYLNVSGDSVIAGNLTFGDADSDSVSFGAEISSSMVPDADSSYDLGSSSKNWRFGHIEQLSVTHVTASGHISGSTTGSFGRVVASTVDINGGTVDSLTSLTVANNVDIGDYDLRASTLTVDSIPSGRVVYADTDGLLQHDSDLTFGGSTLTATTVTGTTIKDFTTISGSATSTGSFGRVDTTGDIYASGRVYESGTSVVDHATAMAIVFGG